MSPDRAVWDRYLAAFMVCQFWYVDLHRLLRSFVPDCEAGLFGIGKSDASQAFLARSWLLCVAYGVGWTVLVRRRRLRWTWVVGALGGAVVLSWLCLSVGVVVWADGPYFGCPVDAPGWLLVP
jgi:hypothetical protein